MKIINISLLVISYLSISHGWECRDGPQHDGVKQIDAGGGFVVMTDDSGAYLLSDSDWKRLGSVGIKHVSAGKNGIFGVDSSGFVYRYVARDFVPSTLQKVKQLDAGGSDVILGVTSLTAYCIDEDTIAAFQPFSSVGWTTINEPLASISCNSLGCWGVTSDNVIYYSDITPGDCTGTTWSTVTGDAVSIEAGADGSVFRVDPDGTLYERTGIDSSATSGTGWSEITLPDNTVHAAYDYGFLWLITDGDEIKECSRSGWFCKSPTQSCGVNQLDAGQGLVVMTDDNHQPHILTGDEWDGLGSTPLKHISVGLAAIWGVDDSNKVYKYAGDEFILDSGETLTQLDAGGGHVLGVTISNELRCLTKEKASAFDEPDSLSWDTRTGSMKYVSCSSSLCWGIEPDNDIFYTTVDPDDCTLGTWNQVTGQTALEVEVDKDGQVYIVNVAGEVYKRTGFTATEVSGTDWVRVEVPIENVEHATYDLSTLWLINNGGIAAECAQA